MLSPFVALSLYSLLVPAAFAARPADCRGLPQNLRVDRDLRPVVTEMLAHSRTLRAQCQRIAASSATRVSVVLATSQMDAATRARSIARRYGSGLLVIEVQLPPASRDLAELLAHELEHVTELIDGVDFRARAKVPGAGVFASGPNGSFESDRARNAGIAAAAEVGAQSGRAPAAAAQRIGRVWRAVARFARAPFRR